MVAIKNTEMQLYIASILLSYLTGNDRPIVVNVILSIYLERMQRYRNDDPRNTLLRYTVYIHIERNNRTGYYRGKETGGFVDPQYEKRTTRYREEKKNGRIELEKKQPTFVTEKERKTGRKRQRKREHTHSGG